MSDSAAETGPKIPTNLSPEMQEKAQRAREALLKAMGQPAEPSPIDQMFAEQRQQTAAGIDAIAQSHMDTGRQNAMWRNKDQDQPVVITGDLGVGPDGREYVSVEGSTTGIPKDEITLQSPDNNTSTVDQILAAVPANPVPDLSLPELPPAQPQPADTPRRGNIFGGLFGGRRNQPDSVQPEPQHTPNDEDANDPDVQAAISAPTPTLGDQMPGETSNSGMVWPTPDSKWNLFADQRRQDEAQAAAENAPRPSIRERFSSALGRIKERAPFGKKPAAEVVDEDTISAIQEATGQEIPEEERKNILGRLRNRLQTTRVPIIGKDMETFLRTAAAGFVLKTAIKYSANAAEFAITPTGLGAFAGGVRGSVGEYLRQRSKVEVEVSDEVKGIKRALLSEWKRAQAVDKKRIVVRGVIGAGIGAIGGAAGAFVAEQVYDHVISNLDLQMPEIHLPEIHLPQMHLPSLGGGHEAVVGGPTAATMPEIHGDSGDIPINQDDVTPTDIGGAAADHAAGEAAGQASGQAADHLSGHAADQALPSTDGTAHLESQVTPTGVNPLDQRPEVILAPNGHEAVVGSNGSVTDFAKNYLTDQLGHSPSNDEMVAATQHLLQGSGIHSLDEIKPGTHLNLDELNKYLGGVKADTIFSSHLGSMPESVGLPEGSNPWDAATKYGQEALGRSLTDPEKLAITKELCRQSGVKVPEWGLNSGTDQHALKEGYKLVFNSQVKSVILSMKK